MKKLMITSAFVAFGMMAMAQSVTPVSATAKEAPTVQASETTDKNTVSKAHCADGKKDGKACCDKGKKACCDKKGKAKNEENEKSSATKND
ncbi:MAG: hypothetical protein WEC59_11560 [Salibacteraceae bacterium]